MRTDTGTKLRQCAEWEMFEYSGQSGITSLNNSPLGPGNYNEVETERW